MTLISVIRSDITVSLSAGDRFTKTNRTMDILTPHDGVTNDKIAKAQIEAVERKQNEYKLIGANWFGCPVIPSINSIRLRGQRRERKWRCRPIRG